MSSYAGGGSHGGCASAAPPMQRWERISWFRWETHQLAGFADVLPTALSALTFTAKISKYMQFMITM